MLPREDFFQHADIRVHRRMLALVMLVGFITGIFWPLMREAQAADFIISGGGGYYNMKTSTLRDMRFKNVIRQERDFSCGSAALATLLTYHYNRPVKEKEVLDAMFAQGDQQKILKEGFSLLDMKSYLQSLGLRSDGFRDSLEKLQRVGIPGIVLVNIKGYLHFVVVKGVTQTKVLLGDPARGTHIVPRKDFEQQWNGILFVILDDMQVAQNHFNTLQEWQAYPAGYFNYGIFQAQHDIAPYQLSLTATPNYY